MSADAQGAVRAVARAVASAGGRALLVGGCVRDELLEQFIADGGFSRVEREETWRASPGSARSTRLPSPELQTANCKLQTAPKDYDIEVFGLAPDRLKAVLAERFALDEVGLSFGVLKLHGYDIDVALPRRETKLGLGHRAFGIECDPSLPLRDAAARRDFTVNAIYKDPLTGEVLDPWGGLDDLRRGVLRHVSDHFREDPLRVLRAMQFLARFDLKPAPETVAVCREMTPEGLPPERQFEEWKKLLVKGVRISAGLEFLRAVGWTRDYPELHALIGCAQAPEWHPEGDVWNHTLCCCDAFASQRGLRGLTAADAACLRGLKCSKTSQTSQTPQTSQTTQTFQTSQTSQTSQTPDEVEDLITGLAVLCHDFGKPATSRFDPAKGRITAHGHDEAGVEPTRAFLRRLTNEERILKEVPPLVRLHMRPFALWRNHGGESAIRRLAAEVHRIDRLIRVCAADDAGRPPYPPEPAALEWLAAEAERLAVKDSAPKPLLMGRDLIALGLTPGPSFGPLLKAVYEAQLDGKVRSRDDALKAVCSLQFAVCSCGRGTAWPQLQTANCKLQTPPYLLWDWNGTLLDDTEAALNVLNIMLERRGAPPIGMTFYRDHFAFPCRPFYEKIGMVLANEDWDALAREYHDLYHAQPKRLNRNALAALDFAARAGSRQSILSALREDLLERDTSHYGVRRYMEHVAGVDNLDGASKLDRARRLLSQLRAEHPDATDFVMIGDALHDKEVADALGIRCVLCGEGSHAAWRLRAVAPTGDDLIHAVRLALNAAEN